MHKAKCCGAEKLMFSPAYTGTEFSKLSRMKRSRMIAYLGLYSVAYFLSMTHTHVWVHKAKGKAARPRPPAV